MNLVFYIFWRAFNFGKRKGYHLEGILLLISSQIFSIIGCLVILIEGIFNLKLREFIPNLRATNSMDRLWASIIIIIFYILIFGVLKLYLIKGNNYINIINNYEKKYKSTNSLIFLFFFILITFCSYFSLWLVGIIFS